VSTQAGARKWSSDTKNFQDGGNSFRTTFTDIFIRAASAIISNMTFLYILLGLMVGVLSGVVGIGGGIMIVPALVYVFHMTQHKAQGTSIAALLAPAGALAFWEYYKAGNVDIKAGVFIALGFLVGGYFGGLWAQHLSELVLRRVFGTLLVIIGIRLLLQR
jgi:uncharacterized membrane protein YfcA